MLTTDEAIASALTIKNFADLELKPFSLMRQVVALELFGPRSGHYFNAIMTVWLCTLEPAEVLKARANVEKAQSQAFAWAEKYGMSIVNLEPVLKLYDQLDKELAASTRVISKDGDKEVSSKNDGGRPG